MQYLIDVNGLELSFVNGRINPTVFVVYSDDMSVEKGVGRQKNECKQMHQFALHASFALFGICFDLWITI